ncbi:MAG: hypothetical protein IT193_10850, partial [Propionibacteriaceae bacterium]|nr:hypothetical protein [Propionibacteriaceae bacterium]
PDAGALSEVYATMVAAQALRAGMLPHEFQAKFPVRVLAGGEQVGTQQGELQQLKTDSEEFRAWFGDSKAVDAQGKPLVVYHGTTADFTSFQRGAVSIFRYGDGQDSGGIFFSSSPDAVGYYTEGGRGQEEGARTIPVYLSVRNPAEIPGGLSIAEQAKALRAAQSAGHDGALIGSDQWVVFRPEQIKSVNNRGTFDPNDPNILRQERTYTPEFRSMLVQEIESLPESERKASGWKQAVTAAVNKGRVRAEEVRWSGITDWLDMQQGKVSKDAVQKFLAVHEVKVETVQLGGQGASIKGPGRWRISGMGLGVWDETFATEEEAVAAQLEAAKEVVRDQSQVSLRKTRDGWAIVDQDDDPVEWFDSEEEAQAALDERQKDEVDAWIEDSSILEPDDSEPDAVTKFDGYTLPGGTNYREVLLTLPGGGFKSQHWDQSNVLAHIRLNDRVDADGKRVLFVEELQSDWAQKGRKEGFRKLHVTVGPLEGLTVTESDTQWLVADPVSGRNVEVGKGTMVSEEEARTYAHKYFATQDKERYQTQEGVSAAPFVENTKGWLNLALKKVFMLAVEGGYDKVAFINGEQSAERYDLSKQIDSVHAFQNRDGTWSVDAVRGGSVVVAEKGLDASGVENLVGKDLAQKILAKSGDPDTGAGGEKGHVYRGVDLKVGGEGMKAFYDEIVPNAVKDLAKKTGGDIGPVRVPVAEVPSVEWVEKRGLGGTVYQAKDENGDILLGVFEGPDGGWFYGIPDEDGRYQSSDALEAEDIYEAAQEALTKLDRQPKVTPFTGLTVTPEMRAEVGKGMPLFQHRLHSGPRGSYDPSSLRLFLSREADPTTFLHELGHHYLTFLADWAAQPNAPASIVEDMQHLLKWWGVESL